MSFILQKGGIRMDELIEPSKTIKIGELSITLCNELIQMINEQLNITFTCDGSLDSIVSAFSQCQEITYGDDVYSGYVVIKVFEMKVTDTKIYKITLEKVPEDPISDDQQTAIHYAIEIMPDDLAIQCPTIFGNWEDIEDGTEIKENTRLNYDDKLWKCSKTHNKSSDYWPGKDPTLFEQLDKEEHSGTLEDPIPVPDSVKTSGFTYIYGKYYLENEKIYLFERSNIQNPEEMYGQEEKLYFPPSSLVGNYFKLIG